MAYSLGIDAGGTYTDAVLLDDNDGSIISANKALTTYPDPLEGIKCAIDSIDQESLNKVRIVSVSTTLSTNTILEGTGFPVALILIGDHELTQELPTPHYIKLSGGHTSNGAEKEPLDTSKLREFAMNVKDKVSAFAISSFYSIRNPGHEEIAKQIVRELTGHPVVCAHELSQDLGAFERATTAFFNAQLIPITEKFMESVEKYIKSINIDPKIFMLKCDGSVIGIKSALEKPIESIFSGPAGSLVGASFLSGNETCAVVDVGGTSTDISVIRDGVPEISTEGVIVGGWKTRVKAIKMETSAMGGDSHVWVKDNKINIGPRRAVPLCRAAERYPEILVKLRTIPSVSNALITDNIQPGIFYIKTGYDPLDLADSELLVYDAISDTPTSLYDIRVRLKNRYPSSNVLDKLLQKRLIQTIAFTPTDALHILGGYCEHNVEASEIGAELLGLKCRQDVYQFAANVKQQFVRNIASDLASFFLDGVAKEEVRKIFDIESPSIKFRINMPVVLIGGPVAAYKKELSDIFDADIILPEYSSVGNAAGALSAKSVRRIDFLIKPVSMLAPTGSSDVFSELGRTRFHNYADAIRNVKESGQDLILKYMEDGGFDPNHINIDISAKEIIPDGWDFPIQANVMVMGVGTRLIDEEIS